MPRLSWLVTLPIAAVAVSFAVANRQLVDISFWPFDISIQAPLYLLTLGSCFAGFVGGAFVFWIASLYQRLRVRRLEAKLAALELELEKAKIAPRLLIQETTNND